MKKSGKPKKRVRIAWNEENLEFLEATKSPKQKINEPKTPYRPPEESDGVISPFPDENRTSLDAVAHAEAVRHALSDVASTSNGYNCHRGGGWTSSEDEAEDIRRSIAEKGIGNNFSSFEEHRRKHYDEYHKVKMLQSQGSQLGDEDDYQEDDNKNKKIAICPQHSQDQECRLAGGVCAIELDKDTPFLEEM